MCAVSFMPWREPVELEPAEAFPVERRRGRARARGALGVFAEGPSTLGLLRRDALARRALAVADVLAAATAVLALGVFSGEPLLRGGALLTLPLLVLILQPAGLYHRDEHLLHRTTLDEVPALFQVTTLYALVASLAADLTSAEPMQARDIAVLWLLLFVLAVIGRRLARCLVPRLAPPERCLVLGDTATAAFLSRKFGISFAVKAVVVGRVPLSDEVVQDANGPATLGAVPVLGDLADLAETLVVHDVHRVIIASSDSADSLEAIRVVKSLGVKISLLPRLLEVVGSSFEFDDVDGVTLLGIRRSELNRSSHLIKRAIDVIAATVGLVVLAPALALIALLIRLDSPGGVLYRQKRIGRHGREFLMLKFRSMVDGADAQKAALLDRNETEGLFKIADDPRITKVGAWLRASSLDELPQLWNILRGEMSLVGPRPLVPDDDAKIHGWQRKRLNVPPGMTGVWQILGSTRVPLEEMVKLDYLYGATWSLWLDLKILLRTVTYVLARRSA
jgi:exopolysaccharide biosynthesis polyprenyl glycosylphosphotransferase